MDSRFPDSDPPAPSAGSKVPVPHRTHTHRVQDAPGAQPDPLARAVRMAVTIGISALAMLLALVGAIKYLQRDWADKNQRARAQGRTAAVPAAKHAAAGNGTNAAETGHPWKVPAEARERFLGTLAGGTLRHAWLLQGFAPQTSVQERRRALSLDLAENGDNVEFRNLCAALFLKHGDVLQAVRQLRLADRIAPGYPPTGFNRALCALMTDLPEQALLWLVRYRARFPEDPQAVRLHFNLLVQLDRADEAMDMLDRFLATQPPSQPLRLDAAVQAAQMNRVEEAIRHLEIAQRGQPPAVIARIYQSPAFREIRLRPEGTAFAERLARRARASLARSASVQPLAPSASGKTQPPRTPVAPKYH